MAIVTGLLKDVAISFLLSFKISCYKNKAKLVLLNMVSSSIETLVTVLGIKEILLIRQNGTYY